MKNMVNSPEQMAFRNPDLSDEERVDSLLALLTLEEKLDCLGTNPSVPRLGLRASGHVEGLHGLAQGGPGSWGGNDPLPTTTFPQAIGLAATWDPGLIQQVAAAEAREARYYFHAPEHLRGGLVVRAPNADLGRDPRWGRTEECFGEDPTLVSRMAVAYVRGLQGSHPRYWQTASLLKHFLANSNENGREHTSSDFDERLLHEYYLAPFRAAVVDGGSRAFMTAYNAVNGIPCTLHPIVRQVAVEQWQQHGIVCTDAHATGFLVSEHKACGDMAEAVARSVEAGVTQFLGEYREGAEQALASGRLSETDLDEALRRTFRVMLRLGLFDPEGSVPYARVEGPPWRDPATHELCRVVTQKSVVLLKNEGGLLPLTDETTSIAVLGPLADRVYIDWYAGTPPYLLSPLEGIRARAADRVRIESVTNNDLSAALAAARRCDVCIVCAGNHPTGDDRWAEVTRKSYGKEAVDRQSLELEDERFIEKVFAANPNTVLVLVSSFPYAIVWSQDHLPAIVHVTHSSQELGRALSDVLFGDVNPGGRTVQTWPRSLGQLPDMLDYDLTHGRTYLYSREPPLYPFGHGLSYTTFDYAALSVAQAELRGEGSLSLAVELSNTGERPGDEVVQLYVRYPESKLKRPLKQLVDFRRVSLAPRETVSVSLEVRAEQLATWSTQEGRFCLEPGPLELQVGRSSSQIELSCRVRVTV